MKTLILLIALFAITLSAADVTGTWKAVAQGANGTIKRTFVFKQDGTRLTGKTISDRWGKSTIENGKIEGDTLSFTLTVIFDIGSLKIFITGKVEGDVIKMTAEASGSTFEFDAKRAPWHLVWQFGLADAAEAHESDSFVGRLLRVGR